MEKYFFKKISFSQIFFTIILFLFCSILSPNINFLDSHIPKVCGRASAVSFCYANRHYFDFVDLEQSYKCVHFVISKAV